MNKADKSDVFDLDLLLKGLYSFEMAESNGKSVPKVNSNENKRILMADGILCEYAYIYYMASEYNFDKDKEDTNTTVSREYLGYMLENKSMFNWLNNPTLLKMCNSAMRFRLSKPALIRGSLKNTLNGFDLIKAGKFDNNVDFSNIFNSLGAKLEEKLPSVDNALSKGGEFKVMSNLEDTKTKLDGYNQETAELLREMVEDEVEYILDSINALYESGYQGFTPDGLLNKVGTVSVVADSSMVRSDGKVQARYKIKEITNPQLNKFYHWISAQFSTFSLAKYNGNMKPSYNNIKSGVGYYPHYQARNSCGLYGLDRSLDSYLTANNKGRIENTGVLKEFLRERLANIIMEGMTSKFGDLLNKSEEESQIVTNPEVDALLKTYRKVLTTAIVVTESKKNVVVKMKLSPGNREDAIKMTRDFFEKAIKAGKIFTPSTKITYYDCDESFNIVTVTFMMNEDKYNKFPLFAFQAVEAIKRNGKPSWDNVVVGKTIEDKIFTLDLTPNTVRMVPIIAGSRSGKGVMTLNFLANAFALQYPVFYLDHKSEMGYTFYKLARDRGVETYVYDGEHSSKAIPRDYDLLTGVNKLPGKLKDIIDKTSGFDKKSFALMTSYIRGLQLLDNLLTLRAMAFEGNPNAPYSKEELGGERVVFVWDEFEKFGLHFTDFLKKGGALDNAQANIKDMFPDVKDAEIKKLPEWRWFDQYKSWAKGVFDAMLSHDKAQWSQARVTIFLLAQSVEIDKKWNPILGDTMGSMIRNSLKVCGRGSDSGDGSSKYGSGKVSPEWKSKLKDRYFIIQKEAGGSVEQETSSLVKGYFLLDDLYDENGEEASCVQQLFSNLGASAASVRAEVTVDGKLNPALAFDGYMKLLADGNDVFGPTLKASWDIASIVAKHVFGYDNLNDYMYDVGNFNIGGESADHVNEYDLANKKKDVNDGTPKRNLSSQSTVSMTDLENGEAEEESGSDVTESNGNSGVGTDDRYDAPPTKSLFGNLFSGMHLRTDEPSNTNNTSGNGGTVRGSSGQVNNYGMHLRTDIPSSTSGQSNNVNGTQNNGNNEGITSNTQSNTGNVDVSSRQDSEGQSSGEYTTNQSNIQPNSGDANEASNNNFFNDRQEETSGTENDNIIIENSSDEDEIEGFDTDTEASNNTDYEIGGSGATQNNGDVPPDAQEATIEDILRNSRNKYNDRKNRNQNIGSVSTQSDAQGVQDNIPNRSAQDTSTNAVNAQSDNVSNRSLNGDQAIESTQHDSTKVENVASTPNSGVASPNMKDNVSVNNRQNVSDMPSVNRDVHTQENIIARAYRIILQTKQDAHKNGNTAWFNLQVPAIKESTDIIIKSEKNNGCNLVFDDSDIQAKLMIVETALKGSLKSHDVRVGKASGIMLVNPNLINILINRTNAIRQRREQQVRGQQTQQNVQNTVNNNRLNINPNSINRVQSGVNNDINGVSNNSSGIVSEANDINLDNQARQYSEMQQRLQQQRAAQQVQQQALQQQREVQQAQQEQFSVNDYESGINFSNNMGTDQIAYQARTQKDNALKVNLRNIKAQVFGLTSQNSMDVSRTRNMSPFKRSTLLSRTAYGAKVYRREGFKALLDTIDVQLLRSQIGSFNNVSIVVMRDDTIVINNLVVDLNGVIGGITGRTLRDTVNFKELAKRYPRISILEVDDDLLTTFCLEFEISPSNAEALFNKVFQLFPSLSTFRVGQYEITRNEIMLRAQDRRIAEKEARIAEKAQRKRSRSQFDAEMVSMTNARASDDSELSGNTDYYNSRMMSQAERKVKAKNITKGIAGFGLTAAAFTVGALAGGFSMGRNLFRKRN